MPGNREPKILTFDIAPYYKVELLQGEARVWSSKWPNKPRLRKLQVSKSGYLRFMSKGKHHLIHQEVAKNFIGKRPEGLVINHIDGNKFNNDPSNLEYYTPAENVAHSIKMGFHVANDPKRRVRYKDGRAVKGRIKEYKREWYLKNRDRILQQRKVRYYEKRA